MASIEMQMVIQDLRTSQRWALTALKTLDRNPDAGPVSREVVEGIITQIDEAVQVLRDY